MTGIRIPLNFFGIALGLVGVVGTWVALARYRLLSPGPPTAANAGRVPEPPSADRPFAL